MTQVKSWLVEAFVKAGIAGLGPRLWAIVEEAGLRPLGMIGSSPTSGPATRSASPSYWIPCVSPSR